MLGDDREDQIYAAAEAQRRRWWIPKAVNRQIAKAIIGGIKDLLIQLREPNTPARYNLLQAIERPLGTRLVGGGRVFYRASDGSVQAVERGRLPQLAASGAINADSTVFDTGLTNAGDWRDRFETSARESWVGTLFVNSP